MFGRVQILHQRANEMIKDAGRHFFRLRTAALIDPVDP
jgi:hypothetical protein